MPRFGQLTAGLALGLCLAGPAQAEDGKVSSAPISEQIKLGEDRLAQCFGEKAGYSDGENSVGKKRNGGQVAIMDDANVSLLFSWGQLHSVRVLDSTVKVTRPRVRRNFMITDSGISGRRVNLAGGDPTVKLYLAKLTQLQAKCTGFIVESAEPEPPHASDVESHQHGERAHPKHSERPQPQGGPQ